MVAGCVAFVGRELAAEWDRAGDAVADAHLGCPAAGPVPAAGGMAAIAVVWTDVLDALGVHRRRRDVVAWYFLGELGKYVPGGVWPVIGRGELARRGGVERATSYGSVVLSLLALYLAALATAAVAVPAALAGDGGPTAAIALVLLLPLGLAALHHRVLDPLLGWVRRRTGRAVALDVPRWGTTLALVARYVPAWLLVGGATWAVARALTPDPSLARIVLATALSWTAGSLAVPVPAGAGVREAVFVPVAGLPGALAATVAIAARLAFIVADGAGAAAAPALRSPPVGSLDRRPEER